MATVVLAGVGAAIGGSIGGAVLGVSGVVIGKFIGATLGSVIDQRLLGSGSQTVESGKVRNFRVMGASEGVPVPRVYGKMRVPGQVIWSTRFKEHVKKSGGGGKGGPSEPEIKTYSYSTSVAIALCEGEITRIGKIWADGKAFSLKGVTMRIYNGTEDQGVDPLISAIEGAENATAYRGTSYVVFERLGITKFGNRVPQFSFEVYRRPKAEDPKAIDPTKAIRGVALVPGTGEYSLATSAVSFDGGKGVKRLANVNNDAGRPDVDLALEQLDAELPECDAVSLVVSWFGTDLRCNTCEIEPRVEQNAADASMPWSVSGLSRALANQVSYVDGRPGFGGTPTDQSVIESIQKMNSDGKDVMFYPFILMDIRVGNGLPDPYGATEQSIVPWRGRITASAAPGQIGSPDNSPAMAGEIASFFGTADVSDFSISGSTVSYTGPAEWSYRRFILHNAHLCAAAGGVSAFCIGSEMRGLTTLRDGTASFPAVQAMIQLAADVRTVLGAGVKIGYAADWSEYFGYHPQDGSGDVLYHLDSLWADANIDFVGIDNYMPLTDWRDGTGHADAEWSTIYDLDYMRSNIEGGEGYDWYYPTLTARDAQARTPIEDGAYGDPWVFRYKDIRNWWARPHWNRIGGVRDVAETAWVPYGKPIWFTELGCPAVDKGTNQPNVFVDPQSSEGGLPYYSSGGQDEFVQTRYLQAMLGYWGEAANNPVSAVYAGPMIDLTRSFVWAWDARPYPAFPERSEIWSDGPNYVLGHWISGRASAVGLADVVREVCVRSNLTEVDVEQLNGALKGFTISNTETARQSLQPLMLAFGFDCFDVGGVMTFRNRHGNVSFVVDEDQLVVQAGNTETITRSRVPEAETAERVRVGYYDSDRSFQEGVAEAGIQRVEETRTSQTSLPIALNRSEGLAIAERWLTEARVSRDEIAFSVPMSDISIIPGDVIHLPSEGKVSTFRVDKVEDSLSRKIEALRIEPPLYGARSIVPEIVETPLLNPAAQVYAEFLDLPLLTGNEVEHAPHLAVTASPWPGEVAVYSSASDYGYELNTYVLANSVMGETLAPLTRATPSLWSGAELHVLISSEELESRARIDVLNGANAAALRLGGVGDWEVIQFAEAELVGPKEYILRDILRGQAGTETVMPDIWPAGTDFVLLDGSAVQIEMALSSRGLERHYRVGLASDPFDDPNYLHEQHTFDGVGLRPYAPAHLRAERIGGGSVILNWIRRTRVDGDAWGAVEVPLGETTELYVVQVFDGATLLREESVTSPLFDYTTTMQAADGAPAVVTFEVAQISERFGAGSIARIEFDG